MGLDITVTKRRKILCPNCGEVVSCVDVECLNSGGRAWYEFLEPIGYYVPYTQRSEENDWYGKDMYLDYEQAVKIREFVKYHDVYNKYAISDLVASALLDGDDIVINADW